MCRFSVNVCCVLCESKKKKTLTWAYVSFVVMRTIKTQPKSLKLLRAKRVPHLHLYYTYLLIVIVI